MAPSKKDHSTKVTKDSSETKKSSPKPKPANDVVAPVADKPKTLPKECTFEGCNSVAVAKRRCAEHPVTCANEDCSSTKIHKNALCLAHQHVCNWPDCTEFVHRGTRCALHLRCMKTLDGERCIIEHKPGSEFCSTHSKKVGEVIVKKSAVKTEVATNVSLDEAARKSSQADPVSTANDSESEPEEPEPEEDANSDSD